MTKVLSHLPGLTHKDISVLSLGTCVQPLAIEPPRGHWRGDSWGDWGLLQWAPHLLNLLSDSSNRSVNLHMTYLLGENYHRINPLLEKDIDMDDVDCFDTLKEIAEGLDLDETLEFVRSQLTAFPPASEVDWAASHQADADHRCGPPAPCPGLCSHIGWLWCSGTMSLKEVGAFLEQHGLPAEETVVEELFGMYDRDCDGSLDLAEFELLLAVVLEREAAQSGPGGTG